MACLLGVVDCLGKGMQKRQRVTSRAGVPTETQSREGIAHGEEEMSGRAEGGPFQCLAVTVSSQTSDELSV